MILILFVNSSQTLFSIKINIKKCGFLEDKNATFDDDRTEEIVAYTDEEKEWFTIHS